jgi:hypothetical protein
MDDGCSTTTKGKKKQKRVILTAAETGGEDCKGGIEQEVDDLVSCPLPVDCAWGPWTDDDCSGTTKGKKKQKRAVLTASANSGLDCTGTTNQEVDDLVTCPLPVDCQWGPWVDGTCNKDGTINQNRTKATLAANGGTDCTGPTTQTVQNLVKCPLPVDCKWGAWVDGTCNKDGTINQNRTKITLAANGGSDCVGPPTQTTQNLVKCPLPVDCKWGPWQNTQCVNPLLYTTTFQRRVKVQNAANGGADCSETADTRAVNDPVACPLTKVDCTWGPWTDNGCSTIPGKKKQTRKTSTIALNGGKACEGPADQVVDDAKACPIPVDCKWGPWQNTQCVNPLLYTTTFQRRVKVQTAANGGADCSETADTRTVDDPVACPLTKVDCTWGPWTDNGCSTLPGKKKQTRKTSTIALNMGKACNGPADQVVDDAKACPIPVNCEWGAWVDGTCNKDGTVNQSRTKTILAANGGIDCVGPITQTSQNLVKCPLPVDCKWGSWIDGTCNKDRTINQTRTKLSLSANGGQECLGPTTQTVQNIVKCPIPIDCTWGPWMDGTCNRDGTINQSRSKATLAANGGADCSGPGTQIIQNPVKCPLPVDCQWGNWVDGSCASPGMINQSRTKVVVAANGGLDCSGPTVQIVSNPTKCPLTTQSSSFVNAAANAIAKAAQPVDCVWGPWKDNGCSAPGKKNQTRGKTTVAANDCRGPMDQVVDDLIACPPVPSRYVTLGLDHNTCYGTPGTSKTPAWNETPVANQFSKIAVSGSNLCVVNSQSRAVWCTPDYTIPKPAYITIGGLRNLSMSGKSVCGIDMVDSRYNVFCASNFTKAPLTLVPGHAGARTAKSQNNLCITDPGEQIWCTPSITNPVWTQRGMYSKDIAIGDDDKTVCGLHGDGSIFCTDDINSNKWVQASAPAPNTWLATNIVGKRMCVANSKNDIWCNDQVTTVGSPWYQIQGVGSRIGLATA